MREIDYSYPDVEHYDVRIQYQRRTCEALESIAKSLKHLTDCTVKVELEEQHDQVTE